MWVSLLRGILRKSAKSFLVFISLKFPMIFLLKKVSAWQLITLDKHECGSDVEITYRSRNSDKSVVAVLSHSDLGDYVDNQQDTVDDSLDEVDSAVKAMQGSIPYEIDEGITITSLTKKGNNVIINCTLDEDICEIQNFRMISDDVKNGFRGNYKDPDMQKLIRALG